MPFLADIDPVQIIIIVIAMGAGFVQWLWGLVKQKMEESQRSNDPLSEEERAAREAAWRQQTQDQGKGQGSGQSQRPSPRTPPPMQDPWATVRDVFENIKEEARKAQGQPQTPPPVPQSPRSSPPPIPAYQTPPPRQRPHSVRAELRPAPPRAPTPSTPFPTASAAAAKAATQTAPATVTPPVFFSSAPTPPMVRGSFISTPTDFAGLRGLLASPATLRQVVVLREILGPPKALQSSEDSPF